MFVVAGFFLACVSVGFKLDSVAQNTGGGGSVIDFNSSECI